MAKIHKDFHGALSCGFAFVAERFGKDELERYLRRVGENMFGRLIDEIKGKGLAALEEHWNEVFSLEEGDFSVSRDDDREIILRVNRCPALEHMRKTGYPVYEGFCEQCRVINLAIAEKTGLKAETRSDREDMKCVQIFRRKK